GYDAHRFGAESVPVSAHYGLGGAALTGTRGAVLALPLGAVERLVGGPDQRPDVGGLLGAAGDSDAGADRDRTVPPVERDANRVEAAADPLADLHRTVAAGLR